MVTRILAILIAITTFLFIVVSAKWLDPNFAQVASNTPQITLSSSHSHMYLNLLQAVTKIPLVRELLLQQKLTILVKARLWHKVLDEFKEPSLFSATHRLLHLKAIAEFATFQFKQFQNTIESIKDIAPYLLPNVISLTKVLDSNRKNRQQSIRKKDSIVIAQL